MADNKGTPVASTPKSARDRVTRRVAKRARLFPDMDIRPLDVSGLDERDAALASAIDQSVSGRWITLVAIIDACLDQDWDRLQAAVQAPLLVGAAQLLFLERVPDHAAISEAVTWAKRGPRPKSSGLVNAVLRKIAGLRGELMATADPTRPDEIPLHDGRAWRLTKPVFDTESAIRLAQTTGHAQFLVDRWRDQQGPDVAQTIAMHSLVHPPVVLSGIDDADPAVRPHETPGFVVYDGARGGLTTLLEKHPGARVQDVTSAAPVQATTSLHPSIIVDYCAGMGTKTRQLAAVHPEARVVASDTDERRQGELRRVAEATGAFEVVEPSGLSAFNGQVDLLLLDVPCSNTGVLARRLEARSRASHEGLRQLVDIQRQIIADALPLLGPAGTLLYATCSIDRAENEDQVQWMARWHPLETVAVRSRLPQGVPGDPAEVYVDGGFFAMLRAH